MQTTGNEDYLYTGAFGATMGYLVKWAAPTTKSEKKEFADPLNRLHGHIRSNNVKRNKALKYQEQLKKTDEQIYDVFLKEFQTTKRTNKKNVKSKTSFLEKLETLKEKLPNKYKIFLDAYNDVIKAGKKVTDQIILNETLRAKNARPTLQFCAIGTISAMGLTFIYNSCKKMYN